MIDEQQIKKLSKQLVDSFENADDWSTFQDQTRVLFCMMDGMDNLIEKVTVFRTVLKIVIEKARQQGSENTLKNI